MNGTPTAPIVVGYDHSDAAQAALRWAADHALALGAELVIVFVSDAVTELEFAAAQVNTDAIRAEYERHLQGDWTAALRERGIPFRTHVAVGRVATELGRVADREDASLIVIGMSRRGSVSELVFRGAEHDLLKHAVRPVVTVPAAWHLATSS